jgi:hypothetical protein
LVVYGSVQLLGSNGSYARLKDGWREQCELAGEEFQYFAQGPAFKAAKSAEDLKEAA